MYTGAVMREWEAGETGGKTGVTTGQKGVAGSGLTSELVTEKNGMN